LIEKYVHVKVLCFTEKKTLFCCPRGVVLDITLATL